MGGGHTIAGIDYSGTSTAIDVKGNGTNVTVEGNIKSDNGRGVYGTDNTKVTVKGDVKADTVSILGSGKSEITVEGDSVNNSSQNIYARSDSSITVKGDVESKNGEGIRAEDNAKVTVDGDLYGGNNGISAWGDGSTDGNNIDIKIGGDVYGKTAAVDATDGVNIDIKGNVESGGSGIYSAINDPNKDITNTIKVDGNVTVTTEDGYYDYMGVGAWNNSVIDIKGTVTVKDDAGKNPWAIWSEDSQISAGAVDSDAGGIQAGGNGGKTAKIDIAGDIEAGDGYYTIQLWGSDASTVLVGNDVSVKNDGDIVIDTSYASNENSELAVGGTIRNDNSDLKLRINTDIDGNAVDFPEIVIGEISNPDQIIIADTNGQEVPEETRKEVLDNIKYIVNSNPDSMEGKGAFTITKLNGDSLSRDKSDKYDVTTRTEQILVRISVNDGYKVDSFSAGKNNTYVRNEDGSYTVTVADGGGINIEALIKAIENNPDPVKPAPIDSGSGSSSSGNSNRGGSTLTNGTWNGSGANTTFTKADGSNVKNEWADINVNGKVNRYHFDADGLLTKGWYTDNSGVKFYFDEAAGSNYGAMCTGWKLIDGRWYYFMPYTIIRNGISFNAGSMLHDTVTPDGYKVGSDGAWVE